MSTLRHGGRRHLNELLGRLGPLPQDVDQRTATGAMESGIRFFRVPVGLSWVASLPGIETIHRGYRYAMVWPSKHPEGRQYQLVRRDRCVRDRRQRRPVGRGSARAALAVDRRTEQGSGTRMLITRSVAVDAGRARWSSSTPTPRPMLPGYLSNVILASTSRSKHARRAIHDTTPCSTASSGRWSMRRADLFARSGGGGAPGGAVECRGSRGRAAGSAERAQAEPPSSRPCSRHAVGKVNAKSEDELNKIR